MSIDGIKALTFDTGGTILDWHTGFRAARHEISHDWADFTNELRRRSLGSMLRLGEREPPAYNFDQAHRKVLDDLLAERLGA
jgi:2-haloacid dehalogenase